MPLTAPTLTVADNGDGTGGVATITGSEAGSTNTLFQSAYSGIQGQIMTWSVVASRTGDGTIPISGPQGQSFWQVQSADGVSVLPSAIVFQSLTNTALQSVHYRCLLYAQQRVQGLALPGLSSDKVIIAYLPRAIDQVDTANLPLVYLSPLGEEGQPGVMANRDDIEYPCLVTIVDRLNQSLNANLPLHTLWRQQMMRALRYQRLVGVPEIITSRIVPRPVVDPGMWLSMLFYSPFLYLPRSREVRGV